MKNLIASLTYLLLSNAFAASTYTVTYSTTTVHATTKLSKMAFQTLPAPTKFSSFRIDSVDAENKVVTLKEHTIPQSPLLFKIQFVGNSGVNLIDATNNVLVIAPAKIITKPIFGTLIGGHYPNISVNAPVIDNAIKEEVANTIGTNNFKMTLTFENSGGLCAEQTSKDVQCTISIYHTYKIDVE